MTYEFLEMPDVLKETIDYLKVHSSITSRSATVAGDLKGYTSPARWVKVQATGGTVPNKYRVWAQRLDINAYAESRFQAKALCGACLTALLSMKNMTTTDLVVTDVEVGTLPSDLTDPINNDYRFIADITVNFRRR